jgi:hypothetical protein
MSGETKVVCACGIPISPSQQRHHEKGTWHRKHRVIYRSLALQIRLSAIARALDIPASYISYYLALVAGAEEKEQRD